MRPIAEITEVMGKKESVSFSAVRLFLHKLLRIHLVEQPTDSDVMEGIKQTVKSDLEDRYSKPQLMPLLINNKACFLDPRFKSLSFLSEKDGTGVILSVKEEVALGMAPCSEIEAFSDGPGPSKKSKFLEVLDDVMDQLTQDISPTDAAHKEYLCIDADRRENSTRWWKNYSTQLPLLTILARRYLCIPATSVPSERAFSTAGNIVNAKCSCLLPENTNMLTFLAQNLN